jgi:hypothetical protein
VQCVPVIASVFLITILQYKGSLQALGADIVKVATEGTGSFDWQSKWVLRPSWRAVQILAIWLPQFVLAVFLPGKTGYGQATPAGHVLKYNVNGLRAWVFTHIVLYIACYQLRLFSAGILFDEWPALFVLCNVWGFLLTTFAYIKAHVAPSHPDDRKWSGSTFYDVFMGVELNPRFGDWFDFKLFYNGRPGILGWSLINFSFAAKQYELYGHVTNGMVLVNILHLTYILDFFWNEDWYLRTIGTDGSPQPTNYTRTQQPAHHLDCRSARFDTPSLTLASPPPLVFALLRHCARPFRFLPGVGRPGLAAVHVHSAGLLFGGEPRAAVTCYVLGHCRSGSRRLFHLPLSQCTERLFPLVRWQLHHLGQTGHLDRVHL